MSRAGNHERRMAGIAAGLLVVLGAVLGITLDRTLLGRAPVAVATPLTLDAMAQDLDLDSAARARVQERLDSLDASVTRAAEQGVDSLRAAAQRARQELENALPDSRRPQFRQWMNQHRNQMMRMMRGGAMRGGRGGMMGPGTSDSGMMMPGGGGMMQRGGRRTP